MSDVTVAGRAQNVPKSFIREILKVAEDTTMISFAGGLPNPALFPVEEFNNNELLRVHFRGFTGVYKF